MCFEEILKECHKEARRNGLKLVPDTPHRHKQEEITL